MADEVRPLQPPMGAQGSRMTTYGMWPDKPDELFVDDMRSMALLHLELPLLGPPSVPSAHAAHAEPPRKRSRNDEHDEQ